MSRINDWQNYVAGPTTFDMHHFEGLIEALATEAEVREAFDRVPGGPDFVSRIMDLRGKTDGRGVYLHPTMQEPTSEDLKMAAAYRDAVYDRLRDLDDPEADLVKNAPIETMSTKDYRAQGGYCI